MGASHSPSSRAETVRDVDGEGNAAGMWRRRSWTVFAHAVPDFCHLYSNIKVVQSQRLSWLSDRAREHRPESRGHQVS